MAHFIIIDTKKGPLLRRSVIIDLRSIALTGFSLILNRVVIGVRATCIHVEADFNHNDSLVVGVHDVERTGIRSSDRGVGSFHRLGGKAVERGVAAFSREDAIRIIDRCFENFE